MAKVLIVDDDWDLVEAGKLVLEKEGYEVAGAPTRDEGMRAIEEFKPDLLILDIMMAQPDDGIAMAQELRRQGFDKPILILTCLGKATGLHYSRDDSVVPVNDFQEKPIDAATLVAKVKDLLFLKANEGD